MYELPLNLAQAALGAEVHVPTLEGREALKVPPGTQHGRVFRVREKGVPKLQRTGISAGRGDFRVVARVDVPKQLTTRQREILEDLAATFEGRELVAAGAAGSDTVATDGRSPKRRGNKGKKGIFDKVKETLGLEDDQ